MNRLRIVLVMLCLAASVSTLVADKAKKVLVLGIDGLDPKLIQQYVDEGVLPNFERFIAQGDFKPLQTTMPPLSPIAWSTFITGMDPGGHGIFDFVHRDPETLMPYLSMAKTLSPAERGKILGFIPRTLPVGSWNIPLSGGEVKNLREGRAFWQILDDAGVPTTVFRMPANFPPADSGGKAFSGMGTPDATGTPGTFSYYGTRRPANAGGYSGGKFYQVQVVDNRVEAKLVGPDNPVRRERSTSRGGKVTYKSPKLTADFTVHLDPDRPAAKIEVGDEEIVLVEGEWSPWVRVDFEAVPLIASLSSTARFYLQQVRPDFKLYVTPLQINPEDPAMPISTPDGWAHELWENLGYFYTQELPEDTKAFTHGVFTGREFWTQTQFVFGERSNALDYFLERFDEGLLFFYFSSIDQNAHMLWQFMDPDHPGYNEDAMLAEGIKTVYKKVDNALGRTMAAIDDETTLVVMSDHGFAPFYWGVNLNTWLLEKGYVKLIDPSTQGQSILFMNVDWSRTTAYAYGLNGLYVNLRGRESKGIVNPGEEHQRLLDQLEKDLLEMKDPRNGRNAVTLVVQTERDFHGSHRNDGPDIIVGYNWGYRSSWKSPLGEFPKDVFVDNHDAWSGDHAMDYRLVPGVIISNREITLAEPALYDLTVGILDEYGVPKTDEMIGEDCLGGPVSKPLRGGTE